VFFIVEGRMNLEFKDRIIELNAEEMFTRPQGLCCFKKDLKKSLIFSTSIIGHVALVAGNRVIWLH